MHPYTRDSQLYWMVGNDQGQGQEQSNHQTWNDPNRRFQVAYQTQPNSNYHHFQSYRPSKQSHDDENQGLAKESNYLTRARYRSGDRAPHQFPLMGGSGGGAIHRDAELYDPNEYQSEDHHHMTHQFQLGAGPMPEHHNRDEPLYFQLSPPLQSRRDYKTTDYMDIPKHIESDDGHENELFEKNNDAARYRSKGSSLEPSLLPGLMPLEQAKSTPLPEQFGVRDILKKGMPMSNDYPNLARATSTGESHRFLPPISNQDMLMRRINDLKLQTKTNKQLIHELQNQLAQKKTEPLQRSLNTTEDTEDEKVIENVPKESKNRDDNKEENITLQNTNEDENKKLDWKEMSKDRLQTMFDILVKKTEAMDAAIEAFETFQREEVGKSRERLAEFQEQRKVARRANIKCELEIMELQEQVNTLREKLDHGKHETFLNSSAAEEVRLYDDNVSLKESEDNSYYLSEASVQQNLIRAQVEFYFSDYSLKRDKRLLERICAEPRGYLPVKEVLQLPRIRQLCNNPKQLLQALQKSPCIDIYKDESHIGRKNFRAPSEKMFPFRRTVFVYGLPQTADENYVKAMLTPFGGVVKVEMDKGPDTLDRAIMARLMEKHRVFKLLSKDTSAVPMKFDNKPRPARSSEGASRYHVEKDRNGSEITTQYECIWCGKVKSARDGYYQGATPTYLVCLQCAAARAEDQLGMYETQARLHHDAHDRFRDLLIGLPPRLVSQCQTALCVFASQRQASKCVYVRSRLAYNGSFATHYHHYSKLKKDIALQSPLHNT